MEDKSFSTEWLQAFLDCNLLLLANRASSYKLRVNKEQPSVILTIVIIDVYSILKHTEALWTDSVRQMELHVIPVDLPSMLDSLILETEMYVKMYALINKQHIRSYLRQLMFSLVRNVSFLGGSFNDTLRKLTWRRTDEC